MEKPKNGNLVYTSPTGRTIVLVYNQPWAVLQQELKNRLGTSGYTKENLKCKYISKI